MKTIHSSKNFELDLIQDETERKKTLSHTVVRDGGQTAATLSAIVDGLSVCKTRSWPEN